MGPPDDPADRLSGDHLLCGSEAQKATGFDGRGRSRAEAHVRQTGHSARGADGAGGRRGRCRDGLRLGQDHLQGGAGRERDYFLFDLRGAARLPRTGEKVPRERRALYRQLLCCAERRGLFRRFVLLHSQRCALPDGAVHLFPHQRRRHGAVRTHADRGRRGGLCELPRGVHRTPARREPVARRRRGDHRRAGRRGQILHRPELVSRRPAGPGRRL